MYDELVGRLRCQLYGNCPECVNWYTEEVEPNLWRERCMAIDAADAIEDLNKLIDAQLDIIKQYQAYLRKPQWVLASEQLPKENGFYEVVVGSTHKPVRVFEYKPCDWYEGENLWKGEDGTYVFNHFVEYWRECPDLPKEYEQ